MWKLGGLPWYLANFPFLDKILWILLILTDLTDFEVFDQFRWETKKISLPEVPKNGFFFFEYLPYWPCDFRWGSAFWPII